MLQLSAEYWLKLHNQERELLMRNNLRTRPIRTAVRHGYAMRAAGLFARIKASFRSTHPATQPSPGPAAPACC